MKKIECLETKKGINAIETVLIEKMGERDAMIWSSRVDKALPRDEISIVRSEIATVRSETATEIVSLNQRIAATATQIAATATQIAAIDNRIASLSTDMSLGTKKNCLS